MRNHPVHAAKAHLFILGLLTSLASLGSAETASAQRRQPGAPALPTPQLYVISPGGGKAGSTIEISFTGIDLEEPQALLFSHPGIKAELMEAATPPPPPNKPKQPPQQRRRRRPMATEYASKFKVTIPADTPLGIHDVRLVNKWGVSNPRAFVVGDQTEIMEKEPNNDVPQAQRVELNCTIHGSISTPTDVDYFVFHGKRGQRVVVSCLASSVDSRLTAALELYDSTGRQLAFNRHYQNTDALVDATLPADGDYYVRVYEFTHTQGSPEHFYRLTITTAPWIDAVVPPMVEPGKTTSVTLYGRNLPGGQLDPTAVENGSVLEKLTVTVTAPSDPAALRRLTFSGSVSPPGAGLDGFEYRIRNAAGASNAVLLTYARAPVVIDNEANDTPGTAQEVPLPCEIAGRVEKRHDRDWYTFTARKGDVHSIELLSEQLGSPTDMYFVLRQADTKQNLAEMDDNPEVLDQVRFFNRTDDPPVYRFTAPADGKYQLLVASRDSDTRAGPRLVYRVRITPEQPDFRLFLMPAEGHQPEGFCLRQGGQENYTALVWRQGGWTGPVTVTVEGLPAGVTCPPQSVAAAVKQTAVVLSAAANAAVWTGEIKVKGTAVINGQTAVREARSASIVWPVFQPIGIPAMSRLDHTVMLAVREKAPFSLSATLDKNAVFQGATATLTLKLNRLWPEFKTPLQVAVMDFPFFQPDNLPQGLILNGNQPLTMNAGKDTATMKVSVGTNIPPGTYNLVLRATTQIPFAKDPKSPQKPNVFAIQPSTPVALTVLPKQVATLTVNNANPTVKIGSQIELVVRVARMNDYTGEFKVQLALPPNVKGISAEPVTIAAGKDEAKLLIKAKADAVPANLPNLNLQAVALLQGNVPLPQEIKINVNVVK